jgi:SEC-C motif
VVSAGRNDPCPCGSGAKYKRCCLDRELELERLVGELEDAVMDLGRTTWSREPGWCADRFAEFYAGGLSAFGLAGPEPEELMEALLWFLFDCPLDHGDTPLERLRHSGGRLEEQLARSELRAWRIEAVDADGGITAACPFGTAHGRLETARDPLGGPRPGALLVARSLPLGPERWVLLGRAPVVEPSVQAEFEGLLGSLNAPAAEIWRVHGGVLARAAWAWPERREVTAAGEIVESAVVWFEADDPSAIAGILGSDPELLPQEPDPFDGSLRWRLIWTPPAPPARRAPAPEPGVRYELCDEDAEERPYLADVTLDRRGHELWLFAPTPGRLALAELLLKRRLGGLCGPALRRDVEPAECLPRWKQLRWDETGARIARRYRRPHGIAA